MLSKSQVDKIGEQLRKGDIDEGCLKQLAEYQSEFDAAYAYVERILTQKLYLRTTGRPAKSTLSIIEKLRRIKSRLSQIQDISGCRAIVPTLAEQDEIARRANEWFRSVIVEDKRSKPAIGYRAIHLIVEHDKKLVEVQVRTRIQHFWATISEKISDSFGQEIKYGSGNPEVLKLLMELSDKCRKFDLYADRVNRMGADIDGTRKHSRPSSEIKKMKSAYRDIEAQLRHAMYEARAVLVKLDRLEAEYVLSNSL